MQTIDAFALPTWEERGGEYIRRLIRDFSLTAEQAAGIVGNLGMESIGFTELQEIHPQVPGSAGGRGVAQWTGPRRRNFEAWAAAHSLDPDSDAANYGFLLNELRGDYKDTIQELRKCLSLDAAVWSVGQTYERPGGTTATHLPGYDVRLTSARRALIGAKQAPPVPAPVPMPAPVPVPPAPAPAPDPCSDVDLDLLADIIRAAQRVVGVKPDGVLGPASFMAIKQAQGRLA